ncbi:MAG TPA: alpha/beta hydrolase [Frankiaceae bacterium]|nr:alpha/beta hydrolase [Frankiaceae bacterium]
MTEQLDPEAAAFLDRLRAAGAPLPHEGTVQQARDGHNASAATFAGPGEAVADVRDELVAGVPVRIYRPDGAAGVTVFAHGGGWAVGSRETYDTLCRALANRSGSTLVSVDYTLAPDAQHPVQLEQVAAVLDWVRSPAGPAPGEPVAVAGDSAGGFLVAWAAYEEARAGRPVVGQAVIYPAFDPALITDSAQSFSRGHYLETETMHWYWDLYAPRGVELLADADLGAVASLVAPALVLTAGFDPLRDDGRRYVEALQQAGVEAELLEFPGQIHGFVRFTALLPQATEALDQVGSWLRGRLDA